MTLSASPAVRRDCRVPREALSARVVATSFEISLLVRGEPSRIATVGGCAADVEEAAGRLEELVAMFDPHDDSSDVAAINRGAGRAVSCSLETLLLATVVEEATGVDLVADPRSSTVTLGTGSVLDPGLIAHGVALDMVFCDLENTNVIGVLVAVGPLVRAAGSSPHGGPWKHGSAEDLHLLSAGAILNTPGSVIRTATACEAATTAAQCWLRN
jgi:thiamine biosynthesis lipoprotein ApbE